MKNLIKKFYELFPFKKQIFVILKYIKFPLGNFYKRLVFKGPIMVEVEDKSYYMFHYGGMIENELFWKGIGNTWDKDTIWLWIELCKNSKVIFDIGANTGFYSLLAKTINPSALVIAFEPSFNTYKKLYNNIKKNSMDILAEKIAISNVSGTQTFYDVFEDHQYSASLSPDKLKNFEGYKGRINEYPVITDTIDNYIEKNNFDHIDLIKIDVELHEPEVLEGFGKYLRKYEPTIIIEILTKEIAEKLNIIIQNTRYQFFHLKDKYQLQKVEKLFDSNKGSNFLLCTDKIVLNLNFLHYMV